MRRVIAILLVVPFRPLSAADCRLREKRSPVAGATVTGLLVVYHRQSYGTCEAQTVLRQPRSLFAQEPEFFCCKPSLGGWQVFKRSAGRRSATGGKYRYPLQLARSEAMALRKRSVTASGVACLCALFGAMLSEKAAISASHAFSGPLPSSPISSSCSSSENTG